MFPRAFSEGERVMRAVSKITFSIGILNTILGVINLPIGLLMVFDDGLPLMEKVMKAMLACGLLLLVYSGIELIRRKPQGAFGSVLALILYLTPIYILLIHGLFTYGWVKTARVFEIGSVIGGFIPMILYSSAGQWFFTVYLIIQLFWFSKPAVRSMLAIR
jgi:hypothetical protein